MNNLRGKKTVYSDIIKTPPVETEIISNIKPNSEPNNKPNNKHSEPNSTNEPNITESSINDLPPLREVEKRFVKACILTNNHAEAYLRTIGRTNNRASAKAEASKRLAKPNVRAYFEAEKKKIQEELTKQTLLDKSQILKILDDIITDPAVRPADRIQAIDKRLKVLGAYADIPKQDTNVNVVISGDMADWGK